MRFRFIFLICLLGVCLAVPACSPGVYVKLDSTAPARSPIFIGMNRRDVESHLGKPLFVSRLNDDLYRGIYEYDAKPGGFDTLCFDVMDFTTLGLGHFLVSPVDRLESRNYLMAVTYRMEDENLGNDIVVNIKERVKVKKVSS